MLISLMCLNYLYTFYKIFTEKYNYNFSSFKTTGTLDAYLSMKWCLHQKVWVQGCFSAEVAELRSNLMSSH